MTKSIPVAIVAAAALLTGTAAMAKGKQHVAKPAATKTMKAKKNK